MKRLSVCLTLLLIIKFSFAQTVVAIGKVSDATGKPIPFAFVSDQKTRNATYTDSTRSFKLVVDPASTLIVTSGGYHKSIVKLANNSPLNILLSLGKDADEEGPINGQPSPSGFFETHSQVVDDLFRITPKATLDETRGSRFLFTDWMHGYVVDRNDNRIQDNNNLFNYDKINGDLLFTRNKTSAMAVNKEQVKAFIIFDQNFNAYRFENVPIIDNTHYVQLLAGGKNYNIYKSLGTVFEKANFTTNGLVSTGHNYDEYIDKSMYYVVKAQSATFQQFTLSKKSIKKAFAGDEEKVNKFMTSQNGKDIDDQYIKALGEYLNE